MCVVSQGKGSIPIPGCRAARAVGVVVDDCEGRKMWLRGGCGPAAGVSKGLRRAKGCDCEGLAWLWSDDGRLRSDVEGDRVLWKRSDRGRWNGKPTRRGRPSGRSLTYIPSEGLSLFALLLRVNVSMLFLIVVVKNFGRVVMESVTIELRSAEGGDDSKLLIRDMACVYAKACKRRSL